MTQVGALPPTLPTSAPRPLSAGRPGRSAGGGGGPKVRGVQQQACLCRAVLGPHRGKRDSEGEATQAWIQTLREGDRDQALCVCATCLQRRLQSLGLADGEDENNLVVAPPQAHPSLSQALALQLTQAYRPESSNTPEVQTNYNYKSLKQRSRTLTGRALEVDVIGEDIGFTIANHTEARVAGAKRFALAADFGQQAAKLAGMACTSPMSSRQAIARRQKELQAASGGAHASLKRQDRERRANNEEEAKTWSGRRYAADILSALHERHVLLEAQMNAATKAAAAEEQKKTQASTASGASRRSSALSARRRSTEQPLLHSEEVAAVDGASHAKLQVEVLGASGLRGVDFGGINQEDTADPLCICQIPGRLHAKFETSVIKKTLNPEWNETGEIMNYRDGDPLSFTIMDWDLDRRELMGQVTLPSSEFYPDFAGEVQLLKPNGRRGPEYAGTLQVRIQVIGADGQPMSCSTPGRLRKMLSLVA